MKTVSKIIRFIIAFLFAVVTVTVACFTAIFFVSKEEPQDIFLFDHALIYQVGQDDKLDIWFVRKTNDFDMTNGDGIVYCDGAYKSANVMLGHDGRIMYFDSDNLEVSVSVEEDELVGKIVALWQQK